MHTVVIFCEGSFEEHRHFVLPGEARAYCDGFSAGAGKYGGDGGSAFVLPDDADELREAAESLDWPDVEVAKAFGSATVKTQLGKRVDARLPVFRGVVEKERKT